MTVRLRDVWILCLVFLVLDVCLGPWLPGPFYHAPDRIIEENGARVAFCVVLSLMAWRWTRGAQTRRRLVAVFQQVWRVLAGERDGITPREGGLPIPRAPRAPGAFPVERVRGPKIKT